jgi:hypothetical protein
VDPGAFTFSDATRPGKFEQFANIAAPIASGVGGIMDARSQAQREAALIDELMAEGMSAADARVVAAAMGRVRK